MGVTVAFLGTGDAFNARARCHAGYLVQAPSTTLLLDCGPSTLLALKRDGFSIDPINAVVLSHLHGDHFAGLPFLFLGWIFDSPRRRPLTVVGPPGTRERVQDLYRAMYRDLAAEPLPFPIRYLEVTGDAPVQIGAAELRPFQVPHTKSELSLGHRLTLEDRIVVYSGDTGWTDALIDQSRDADLFICECCFYETRVDFHLDYPRIAAERHRFGCKRLMLTHIGREVHARRDEIADEISHDGLRIDL